mmetsp:Transcript_21266/g.34576  ORF Transcript_21266/g.34576 Transcript_21266/m.34576 type:complete len:107 (-) Transcript_21266:2043-2363(-)
MQGLPFRSYLCSTAQGIQYGISTSFDVANALPAAQQCSDPSIANRVDKAFSLLERSLCIVKDMLSNCKNNTEANALREIKRARAQMLFKAYTSDLIILALKVSYEV